MPFTNNSTSKRKNRVTKKYESNARTLAYMSYKVITTTQIVWFFCLSLILSRTWHPRWPQRINSNGAQGSRGLHTVLASRLHSLRSLSTKCLRTEFFFFFNISFSFFLLCSVRQKCHQYFVFFKLISCQCLHTQKEMISLIVHSYMPTPRSPLPNPRFPL